jgi:hypothetical protein
MCISLDGVMAKPNYEGLTDAQIVATWKEWEASLPFLNSDDWQEAWEMDHYWCAGIKQEYADNVREIVDSDDLLDDEEGLKIDLMMPSFIGTVSKDTITQFIAQYYKIKEEWITDWWCR